MKLSDALQQYFKKVSTASLPELLCDGCPATQQRYDQIRQVFNRRFDFRPAVIALVENTAQVQALVLFANLHPAQLRLRLQSGGHDHEGECSGTDTLLLNFSQMQQVRVVAQGAGKNPLVHIQPGARFVEIKAQLDPLKISILHGTCSTVGATGFTLGAGWGPWTRKYGMACERLLGATLVVGDGSIRSISETQHPELLWALRGGGGMSYGAVTELIFEAIPLPDETLSFQIDFNYALQPGLNTAMILQRWENMIASENYPRLLGCNLKVNALPLAADAVADPEACLGCSLFGYFEGGLAALHHMIGQEFGAVWAEQVEILAAASKATWPFEHWDGRNLHHARLNDIVLETPGPAPHKITSRFPSAAWGDAGRRALICSLQSELIPAQADRSEYPYGPHAYITLLAISGAYYARAANRDRCAFPYSSAAFIIQYQAWWDQYLAMDGQPLIDAEKRHQVSIQNRYHSNRIMDWIARSRDYVIADTAGAFISFKDSSVATQTYFSQHYKRLLEIKLKHGADKNLLFQTDKTIV
jgi:hypothetical protein